MVFTVRCFKCGEKDVRLIMGGRSIIHARCHSCEANLLAEVMDFEQQACEGKSSSPPPDSPSTTARFESLEQESSSAADEEENPPLHHS